MAQEKEDFKFLVCASWPLSTPQSLRGLRELNVWATNKGPPPTPLSVTFHTDSGPRAMDAVPPSSSVHVMRVLLSAAYHTEQRPWRL